MGDFRADAVDGAGRLPATDPNAVGRRLFEEWGVDCAVLVPLTRGLLADVDLGSMICTATNDWLAATWLGKGNAHGRFYGSIRVNPGDPDHARAEIERWAGDPSIVQVAVPMQAHRPYGQRLYFPIWEAAARAGLPVAVHADGGAGVDFWPSPAGYYSTFIEYRALYPTNFAYHLASLIAEGVFDRLEALTFVFADGGHSLLAPLIWRMDKDWRPTRRETPWIKQLPSTYLRGHVRFCADRFELPEDPHIAEEWLELTNADELVLYASNYPYWDAFDPHAAFAGVLPHVRERILSRNARELYRLPRPA
jgi:predicted TIM-barrel fold metal-dependent hydrolase